MRLLGPRQIEGAPSKKNRPQGQGGLKAIMYKQFFINNFNALPLSAGTANALPTQTLFTDIPVTMPVDGDFEGRRMVYVATDPRVYLKIKNSQGFYFNDVPALDARLSCGQVVNLGAGSNALIFKNLAKKISAPASSVLTLEAGDFSGAQNNLRIAMHGLKLVPGLAPWIAAKRKYIDEIPWQSPQYTGALVANQTAILSVPVSSGYDFFVERITATRTGAATVELNAGGSQLNLQNTATHIDNFTGNVAGHLILDVPIYIPENSMLVAKVTDISGVANAITMTFEGTMRRFRKFQEI